MGSRSWYILSCQFFTSNFLWVVRLHDGCSTSEPSSFSSSTRHESLVHEAVRSGGIYTASFEAMTEAGTDHLQKGPGAFAGGGLHSNRKHLVEKSNSANPHFSLSCRQQQRSVDACKGAVAVFARTVDCHYGEVNAVTERWQTCFPTASKATARARLRHAVMATCILEGGGSRT